MITKDDENIIKEIAKNLNAKAFAQPITSFMGTVFFPFSVFQSLFDISEPLLSIFFRKSNISKLQTVFAKEENFSFFLKEMEK